LPANAAEALGLRRRGNRRGDMRRPPASRSPVPSRIKASYRAPRSASTLGRSDPLPVKSGPDRPGDRQADFDPDR
jgi:hypothetical protein